MWTLFFDIDGTLIKTGGAGMSAIAMAMMELFGIEELPNVPVQGRTDYAIIEDLFQPFSIDVDENIYEFKRAYWALLPTSLDERGGTVLPGVFELLELLLTRNDVAVGIVTGNTSRSAAIKLSHFGLDSYFRFGGYGDHDADRNKVASLAKQSAFECLGEQFNPEKMWVIGDTPNDICCARSIGSKVVALETGGCESEELREANPDLLLSSLAENEAFVKHVFGSPN